MYRLSFLILFISISLNAQVNDSLLVSDSLIVKNDTLVVSDSSVVTPDSLALISSAKDTISPVTGFPLYNESVFIPRKEFLMNDYRYTGDIFKEFPFFFNRKLGFIGQHHETFVYGTGFNGVSYLSDGMLINNRYSNSLDLNIVQSEDIDSVEIIPAPRSFLYGLENNFSAVNFIKRDFLSVVPYSRIKYYEGPDGEAFIDGSFNALIFKRLNAFFALTNRKVDETYTNSEFSSWQLSFRLKYFFSNSINIVAGYSFVDKENGENGGVDIDSLRSSVSDVNTILFDPQQAPVLYPNRIREIKRHNPFLRFLFQPGEKFNTNLTLYYDFFKERISGDTLTFYNENKTFGYSLNQLIQLEMIDLKLFTNYEKRRIYFKSELGSTDGFDDHNLFTVGGSVTLKLLNDRLKPSLFIKHLSSSFEDRSFSNLGLGADVSFALLNELNLYAGFSTYKKMGFSKQTNIYELGADFINEELEAGVKYFSKENVFYNPPVLLPAIYFYYPSSEDINGTALSLRYKIYKILFEFEGTHYFGGSNETIYGQPEYIVNTGIYLNSMLFDDNLYLKGGFVFNYFGKIRYSEITFITEIDPSYTIDFTLAGEIRKSAIFYFTWENLLDEEYYLVPYYPMPRRGIRFGLAWEFLN